MITGALLMMQEHVSSGENERFHRDNNITPHLDTLHLAQLNRDVIQLIFLWGGEKVEKKQQIK